MSFVKIKICGITNIADAELAVELGADLLGFNFYSQSPRYVTADQAAKIISRIPAFIDIVGIFVNADVAKITETVKRCNLDWIQFHGDEPREFLCQFDYLNVRTIKAIRVKTRQDMSGADDYPTDAVLFDAFDYNQYGGTGKTFDWNLLGNFKQKVFLAGGIDSENVHLAARQDVYAIDVCSKVESKPGIKDADKMKKLFENIRRVQI